MIEELRRAYTQLLPHFEETLNYWHVHNPEDYPNSLKMPMPVITIQRKGRRKSTKGWYKTKMWDSDAAEAYNTLAGKEIVSTDEICITAEALKDATAHDILTDLTHQMVHHYAAHNTYYRTLGKNDYHNTGFKGLAQRVGLTAELGTNGYSDTVPATQRIKDVFDSINLDMNVFDMFRKQEGTDKRKGSKLKRWACKCTTARVATYLDSTCNRCGEKFTYDDKDKDELTIQDWLEKNNRAISDWREWVKKDPNSYWARRGPYLQPFPN